MGSAYQVYNYIESNFLWNNLKLSRVNLAFPILYVLATIVICGLPMIITPVETAIGLAMILSGNTAYVGHQGTTLEAAHSDMIY